MWYKNTQAQNLFILLVFTAGLLGTLYLLQLKEDLTPEEEYMIEREVFSHLFGNNHSAKQNTSKYYFIGVSNSDPSLELLESFSDHVPKVKPLSKAQRPVDFGTTVTLRDDSTKSGIIFHINKMSKRLDGKVYVEASYYEAYMSSASYNYLLEIINDECNIITFELAIIS